MIFAQTFKDFEVIIVDSGSTDGALEIMKKYPVEILHYKGPVGRKFNHAKAFNFGAGKAKGENLVKLSGDAIPADKDWLKHLVDCVSTPKIAGASSRYLYSPLTMLQFRIWFSPLINRYWRKMSVGLWGASCIIKKGLWKQYPFNEEWGPGEDWEWGEVMKINNYKIVPCWQSKVYHEHRAGLIENIKLIWWANRPKDKDRERKHFEQIRRNVKIN